MVKPWRTDNKYDAMMYVRHAKRIDKKVGKKASYKITGSRGAWKVTRKQKK